jgi:spore maturation protein CgeB
MRILLCPPSVNFSVADVSRGYSRALRRAGCDVVEYPTRREFQYNREAIGEAEHYERFICFRACERILQEATYHKADLVLFICSQTFHPIALQLLKKYDIPAAVIHTESPYQDDDQVQWVAHYPGMTVFTHEQYSAEKYGWHYLPHAYDPEVHQPAAPDPAEACDVLMVGWGWPERQKALEAVDWTGIKLVIRGRWDGITEDSPLFPYYRPGIVPNADLPRLYASAKINLNIHRAHPQAKSLNPRAYELAACGAFQWSDRAEPSLFGRTLSGHLGLERAIRHWLLHDDGRRIMAEVQQQTVRGETFDARVRTLLQAVSTKFTDADLRLEELVRQ